VPTNLKQLIEKWRKFGKEMAPTGVPSAASSYQNYGSALKACADELAAFRKEWLAEWSSRNQAFHSAKTLREMLGGD
jgi:hypothetical protein